MSGSHDKLPKLFWIQLALAAFIGVMFLITPAAEKSTETTGESSHTEKAVAKNLEPIGKVMVQADSGKAGGTERSGKDVFNRTCGTCHNTGIANAPKVSDKAAWEPRIANGIEGLVKTAINGKGAMPPKGGDPTLTANELKSTIHYMTNKAGINLSSTEPPKEKAIEEGVKKAQEEKHADMVKQEEPVKESKKATESMKKDAIVTAPTAPVAPPAPAAPVVKKQQAALETIKEKVVSTSVAVVTPPAAVEKPVNLEAGKKVYSSSCFACHDSGVAGSPKIGDKTAWASRIATGTETLYTSALNGKGVMPAKGGNAGIPDGDIKAAVDYMVSQGQ